MKFLSSAVLIVFVVLAQSSQGLKTKIDHLNLSQIHEFYQLESEEGSGDFSQEFLDDYDTDESSGAIPKSKDDQTVTETQWTMQTFGLSTNLSTLGGANEDIHFEEDSSSTTSTTTDDNLYEYYSEYFEEDYDEDDDDEDDDDYDDDEDNDDAESEDETEESDAASSNNQGESETDVKTDRVNYESSPPVSSDDEATYGLPVMSTYLLYVMLATAIISFFLGIILFFLCRKSALERRAKKKMVPFVLSSSSHHYGQSATIYQPCATNKPIVKNYQRVPTSTREMLQSSTIVEMPNKSALENPLLP